MLPDLVPRLRQRRLGLSQWVFNEGERSEKLRAGRKTRFRHHEQSLLPFSLLIPQSIMREYSSCRSIYLSCCANATIGIGAKIYSSPLTYFLADHLLQFHQSPNHRASSTLSDANDTHLISCSEIQSMLTNFLHSVLFAHARRMTTKQKSSFPI